MRETGFRAIQHAVLPNFISIRSSAGLDSNTQLERPDRRKLD